MRGSRRGLYYGEMEQKEGLVRAKEAALFSAGEYCVLKTYPCCVTRCIQCGMDRHGSLRIEMQGIELFTAWQRYEVFSGSQMVAVPDVRFSEHRLVGIGKVVWFELEGGMGVEGLPVLEGRVEDCVRGMVGTGKEVIVTVMCVEGEEAIVGARVSEE